MNTAKSNIYMPVIVACLTANIAPLVAKDYELVVADQNLGGSGCNFGEYKQTVSPTVDPILNRICQRLVPASAVVKNKITKQELAERGLTFEQCMAAARKLDNEKGPKVEAFLTGTFARQVKEHVSKHFGPSAVAEIERANAYLVQQYKGRGVYALLKPHEVFLGSEKDVMDAELDSGKKYPMSTVDRNEPLVGATPTEVMLNTVKSIMTPEIVRLSETPTAQKAFAKKQEKMTPEQKSLLPFFESPLMRFYYYALYQAASVDIALAGDVREIKAINDAKREYSETSLVDAVKREKALVSPLRALRPDIFCGQEVSPELRDTLVKTCNFLPLTGQNLADGVMVGLNKDRFARFEVVPLNYEKWKLGSAVTVLAYPRDPEESLLQINSGHASTSRAEDAPMQIKAFLEANTALAAKYGHKISMITLMDANCANADRYKIFKASYEGTLDETDPKHQETTDKERLLTVQVEKVLKRDKAQKDFILVSKGIDCTSFAVGLPEHQGKAKQSLPNSQEPCDHRLLAARLLLHNDKHIAL